MTTPQNLVDNRMDKLKKALKNQSPASLRCLEALGTLFGSEQATFRRELWALYESLFEEEIQEEGFRSPNDGILELLMRILSGWNWIVSPNVRLDEDAEDCFRHFCKAYGQNPRLREELKRGLRKHLNQQSDLWNPGNLVSWITHEDTPVGIREILLHARVRFDPDCSTTTEELRYLAGQGYKWD